MNMPKLKKSNDSFWNKLITLRSFSSYCIVSLLVSIWWWAPHNITAVTYKLCLVTLACMLAWAINKVIFPTEQVDDLSKELDTAIHLGEYEWANITKIRLLAAQMRHAVITLATIVGICLGM